ncbi:unnamed protein product [Ixodes pacificus]
MPTTAYLDHNGEVWYCPPSKIKVSCGMDVRRFPFDAHICKIRLSSEDDQVKLSGRPLHPSALPLSRNASSEWSLKSITFSDSQVLNMTCLDIAFEVERRSHHYLYDVTLPWASSFVLMLVVFWMPADSDRRLTLIGLNLVFITQIMWRVTALFGTSITSPRIVIYLGSAMLIEAVAAVSTVVILNMATAPVPARIPDAVVRFLSGPVGPLMCLRHYSELGEEKYVSHSQLLRAKLFDPSKYDVNRRPTKDSSSATEVSIHFYGEEVTYMNLQDDWLTLAMVTCKNWYDPALEWDPDDYGGLQNIHVSPSKIWYPDIKIVNTRSDDFASEPIMVYLHHDGEVWCCPPATVRIPCSMDLTDYPFDSQVCSIRFALLTYGDEEVRLGGESIMSLSVTNQSSEWQISFLDTSQGRLLNNTSLDIAIGMRRRGTHHRYTATLPWIASVIMMLLGFWMPANSSRRLTLACINLLLVMLMLQRITALLNSSAVPKIGGFLVLSSGVIHVFV